MARKLPSYRQSEAFERVFGKPPLVFKVTPLDCEPPRLNIKKLKRAARELEAVWREVEGK